MNKSNAVINEIHVKLGKSNAVNYRDSASMFNAVIETCLNGRYFLESSQFVGSNGKAMAREYCLKVIGDNNISKVLEFGSKKTAAFRFWENLEFTKKGGLVLERSQCTQWAFDGEFTSEAQSEYMYQSAYSYAFNIWFKQEIRTYAEGDYTRLHFATEALYKSEVKAFIKFDKENN